MVTLDDLDAVFDVRAEAYPGWMMLAEPNTLTAELDLGDFRYRVGGRFEIFELALEGTTVRQVLVSFDHYCEERDLVRGCLHYVAP